MTRPAFVHPVEAPRFRLSYPYSGVGLVGSCTWEGLVDNRLVHRDFQYALEDDAASRSFLRRMPPELADLLDVALAAYTIDRLSRRRVRGRGVAVHTWQRNLELSVPVRDVDRWLQPAVCSGLSALLSDLTEDRWTIEFCKRRGIGRPAEMRDPLFSDSDNLALAVCLFSGGLDSLAGTVGQLLHDPDRHLACVGGCTNPWFARTQRDLIAEIGRRFGGRTRPLQIAFNLSTHDHGTWPEEQTQRSRGFIHLVLGVVAAVMAGLNYVIVHENGVGALNLPYTAAQFGTRMSRATHPLILADAAAWLTAYLGFEFRIIGSSLNITKAQACQAIAGAKLGPLVTASFSCDGFQRVAGQPQCGTCTSCLLRRQAVYASGLAAFDDAARYRFDVTDPSECIPSERLVGLRLMLHQLSQLSECLASPEPWHSLIEAFPSLLELEARAEAWQAVGGERVPSVVLPALYKRYVAEWQRFPAIPPWHPSRIVPAA